MATNTDGREEIKPVAPTEQTKWRDPSLVGKYMVDPKTGLAGLFRSPDNGETWVLTDTVYGHVYNQDEVDNIWDNGAGHKVADEIKSATADLPNVRKQADSAVKFAESAIAASKVNSDAIVAQSEAISEAKSAMDSATAEIQQTAANAASDAAKIRADVARVQNEVDTAKAANSASVEALKSDINTAKQDLADVHDSLTKAQAAAEQNQKAIDKSIAQINDSVDATNQDLAGVRKDLTKAQSDIAANQKAINDNVAQINSDITQDRKDIASAQQANTDTAKQLDTYSKQAVEQGKTIKTIQDKQDGFTATLADVQDNVTQVSDKVDGLSASLKDAQDNVASVKAQADQLSATLTDHANSIATLTASAKELSSTLEDADGRLSKVEQTAQTNSSTLSDLQGDLSQVKQGATTLTATLKDVQGNISTLQQKADSVSTQLASAQGDIATLQTGVDGVKATLASHDKTIHTLQLDSKSLKDSMADAQGDISTLQKSATSLDSEMKDHAGRLSKVEQSAATQATTLSDVQGNLTQVKQQADGLVTTLKDTQGDITQIQQKADGTLEQLKSAQGDIASLQTDVTGIKATLTSHEGDIHTLQADSKTLKDDMADAKGNISSLQKTSTSLVSEFRAHDGRLSKVEQTATEHTSELADTKGNLDKVTQKADNLQLLLSDAQKNIQNIQLDAKGLHDTLTGQDNQLASLNVTLNNLDSKYSGITGDLKTKQIALSTEQQQTKDMLLRKADKSEVDNVKGTVNQVSAEQKIMADQISQKVSSSEYQTLKDKVDGMKIGGRNYILNSAKKVFYPVGQDNYDLTWNVSKEALNANPDKNGQYKTHFSFDMQASSALPTARTWRIYWRADPWTSFGTITYPANTTDVQHYELKITTPATQPIADEIFIRFMKEDTGKSSYTITNSLLTIGDVFEDYSPNPDDTIAAISKNTTAIDENSKAIKLKADQTEVDNVKNTASYNSSRLDVMANEISSKVTSTDVNNIVDSKGYATTSIVQSLVDQKAGTLNESITNLEGKFNSSSSVNLAEKTNQGTTNWMCDPGTGTTNLTEVNINGVRGVRFNNTRKTTSWWVAKYVLNLDYFEPNQDYIISFDIRTSSDNFNQGGMLNVARGDSSHPYLANTSFKTNFKQNQLTHVSCTGHSYSSLDKNGETFYLNCAGLGQCDWVDIVNFKIARGKIDKGYSPAPSDNATVTQLQSVTASIDGLQSNVTNYQNDTSSRFTQLSNVIQSKVSASDFNALKDEATWKSTDSIDLNTAVLQQKIFVKGGSNLPPGDYWWYVQVEPGYDSRIVQYAVSDRDNIHYSRQYDGSKWSAWSQGATESEITQLRDDINLRVKSGDLLSQINLTAGNTLIQSNKLYLDASSVVITGTAFIPSAAIASLSADKITTGLLNTNNINLGDGRTRLMADHDNFYIQPAGSASSNSGIRMGYDSLSFMTNDIPNGYGASVPYYSINYDGSSNGSLNIQTFDHINPGGATSTQNWYSMSGLISLSKKQIDFATNNNIHMHIDDGGVTVRPTLFFGNSTWNDTWAGFTRLDNSNTVEFNTGDNNGENFHVNSGARFMQYVYINGYARAQGWLTNSTLSKKTNIRKLDTQVALDKIRQDDQYLYEYKRNVAQGIYDPQASFIIDDVNDVSHYSVPREFIDQSGNYREPNVELAYLIAAFQAIDKQVQLQQAEIKELKEKLQHE